VEIKCLQAKKPIPKSGKLISLNPFMDDHGVVRVGGRLGNAPISYARKYPVVLPKISILKRVGSILVPRGVFRLIIQMIGCTFIVKIVVICV
jgi:hypothetical protein